MLHEAVAASHMDDKNDLPLFLTDNFRIYCMKVREGGLAQTFAMVLTRLTGVIACMSCVASGCIPGLYVARFGCADDPTTRTLGIDFGSSPGQMRRIHNVMVVSIVASPCSQHTT